jgi:hypothetical protein
LDGKLTAEILRMPSKRFNDVSGLRWPIFCFWNPCLSVHKRVTFSSPFLRRLASQLDFW